MHDGDGLVVVRLDLADVLAGVIALDPPDLQVVPLQLDPTVAPNLRGGFSSVRFGKPMLFIMTCLKYSKYPIL